MPVHHAKVDAYIAKAELFAQPILARIRKLVHSACPGVEETIKWSRPFFDYKGAVLCNMSAFKAHCSIMFWGLEMAPIVRKAGAIHDGDKGLLRRIPSIDALPSDRKLLAWIRQAAAFIDSGEQISPIAARGKGVRAPRPLLKTPPEFTAALNKNKKASAAFAAFSPSCKREYVEWIADAKRPETRDRRIATAIAWIAEGKPRSWKYQK